MIENIAVSMELPPFWKHDPEMWFAQIESQFFNYRITLDESKFHTIVGQIETEILEAVSDIVKSPPTENKYDELKKRLIQHFSKSTQQKTEKILAKTEMNDKKPSFVLQEIKNLAGSEIPESVIKSLWMKRLPVHTQQILALGGDDLSRLAELADRVSDFDTPQAKSASETVLKSQIAQLTKTVDQLCGRTTNITHSSTRSCDRPRKNNKSENVGR